jgi:hypothetical protein
VIHCEVCSLNRRMYNERIKNSDAEDPKQMPGPNLTLADLGVVPLICFIRPIKARQIDRDMELS